ncbi:MAG: Tim44-like domain-containing protein [Lautropia sp.]|nr:Tim44-like domain-containing protein [Lautropia sp.]
MKKFLMMLMVVLCSSVFLMNDADAKRVGGGRSVGKQNNTVQREAAPQPSQAAPAAAQPGAAAAKGGASRWAGPLAGLAAGLGLAALASALGFGEGFGVFLLILLMGLVVLVAVRMFMAKNQANRAAAAGVGAAGNTNAFRSPMPQAMNREAAMPQSLAPQAAVAGGSAAAAMAQPVLPAGFDAEAFVRQAKVQFVRLQAAFDTKNVDDLREFTSPEMFGELNIDLMQRGDAVQNTDVVELDARLLGVQEEGVMQMASVHFSGMIREEADAAAERFEEVWNFTRPASGASGWVLAGIQQV